MLLRETLGTVSNSLDASDVLGWNETEGVGRLGTLVPLGEQRSLLPSPPALSECQGKLQELHRLLQSLESLHRIPSAPVIPTHQVRVRGGGRDCSGPLIPITLWGRPARQFPGCFSAPFARFSCYTLMPTRLVLSSMASPNSVTELTLQLAGLSDD